MDSLLKGQVAIITGAASGIGRAAARLFAEHGARVLIADVDEAGGREAQAEIAARGVDAMFVPTDVSRAASVRAMVDAAVGRWGTIDVLYNNLGRPEDVAQMVDRGPSPECTNGKTTGGPEFP